MEPKRVGFPVAVSLIQQIHQGIDKIRSLLPIYGLKGTINIIKKNIFWFELDYRLDDNLSLVKTTVIPGVPLRILVLEQSQDLAIWEGKKQIIKIRGQYGLTQFENRLKSGVFCFVAYSADEFAGFVWVKFPPVLEKGYTFLKNEAYTYDGWTFEECRGKGVLPFILQGIANYARERRPDVHNIVNHVATWNKSSLSGDQRAGYVITRKELLVVVLGYHHRFLLKKLPRKTEN